MTPTRRTCRIRCFAYCLAALALLLSVAAGGDAASAVADRDKDGYIDTIAVVDRGHDGHIDLLAVADTDYDGQPD
jgi:hypothetical protein